jgi:hypothetical protein
MNTPFFFLLSNQESNANEFEAYIDPDDEYDMKDRFSQVD